MYQTKNANLRLPAQLGRAIQSELLRIAAFQRPTLRMVGLCLAVIVGLGVCGPTSSPALAQVASAQQAFERLSIRTGDKTSVFEVEVMRTVDERSKGLMFRRYLPDNRGMLFDFGTEAPVAMWMKDTFIPLDMVFIRKDGTISKIVENTEPHSLRTITSEEPVLSVLELNGGTASRLGIKPGDVVLHSLFKR